MKVKICGIKNLKDAENALEAGADFLGFNFYPKSPRYLEPSRAAAMVKDLPRGVAVALFVNPAREELLSVAELCGIEIIQLQGDEPPELTELSGRRVIKAFRLGSPADLTPISRYKTWAVLADAKTGLWGGSGRKGDWELSARAKKNCERLILAGGLDPENVADAIRAVRPWAVDVCSGVESEPGVKDPAKVKKFIEAVKNAT